MKRALIFFAVLVVIAGGIVGVALSKTHTDKVTLPSREVDTFLHAWSRDDPADMATLLNAAPSDLATTAGSLVAAEPGSTATYTRTGLSGSADEATATYHAVVKVKGVGQVTWDGSLALVHSKTGWLITWKPDTLYPDLAAGQHLTLTRTWPARAPILAADGSVLIGGTAAEVGVEPDHIKSPGDVDKIKFAVQALLGVSPAEVDHAIQSAARPFYFQHLATIPKTPAAQYATIHTELVALNGIIFRPATASTATDSQLGSAILGSVGAVTADELKVLGAPYKTGDQVGQSGLESVYERRLAGTPRTSVVVANAKGTTVRTVKSFGGATPKPVRVTIDPATQKAAETALAGVTKNAALVAIDPTSGAIKAVVSKPDGGFNRAIVGTYPPGSTFKVITSAALIAAGDTGSTAAPCPQNITVDGQTFANFEGEASLSLDLAHAFAQSCNNAFIGLADKLPADALGQAAATFGFNTKWSLGIDAAGGSYPTPKDRAERAASAIGQGRVLASPVQMASVAAAVANGQWLVPSLVTEPAPPKATGPTVPKLAPLVDSTLKSFMATVPLAGGTAAGAGLPPETFGKTGTAEFGSGNPPPTHAWFIGFRASLAFAVIVEDGGVGGTVAAPLAAGFLNNLPH